MRYLLSEDENPNANDYYYECRKITNPHSVTVSVHTHDYYEIYMFLSGSVKLFVEDTFYKVKRGDIIVIPPYTIHQLIPIDQNQEYDRMFMLITETCLASFNFNEHSLLHPLQLATKSKRYLFHINDTKDYDEIFQAMYLIHRTRTDDYYGKEMLNRSRIIQIMTLLNKYILSDMAPKQKTKVHPTIDKVLAYINEHYAEQLTIENLSEQFFIDKYALTRFFKKQTARTLHNYITLKRISIAKQKIAEGISPSAVYYEVGYLDYSSFYRAFHKMEGVTPKEFAEFCKVDYDNKLE